METIDEAINMRIGTIVRVKNPKLRFNDKQGYVVEISSDGNLDGPIGVKFPNWHDRLFDYPHSSNTVVRFSGEELVVEGGFDPLGEDKLLKRLFGQMGVWTIERPNLPLVPGESICMHRDCQGKAWFEAWVNVWGAVSVYYVCPNHACFHGRCCDGFPYENKENNG